jgi:BirA family biotin operon repressor/biotin-[acetyl-CoA-carboxylase] ligase
MVFFNMDLRERVDKMNQELSEHVENLVLFEVTGSTHGMARRVIAEMDDESQKLGATLIVADRQDSGEGRGDRKWESPEGGLYLNWLRSGLDAETILRLPMLAAVAAHAAVTSVGVSGARIKWPNDILVGDRKLAGLLVFARHGETNWVTVGLGINLESAPTLNNSEALPATAVTEHVTGLDLESCRHSLVCTFISELDRSMDEPGPALARWRELLIQRPGDRMQVRMSTGEVITGTLVDLSEEGFLRIRENGQERVVTGGDIIES